MAGWKTSYLLGWLPGRCYVGCREGMFSTFKSQKEIDQSAPKNHGSFLFHTSNFFPPWTSRCRRYFLGSVGNFRQEIHTFHTIHGTGIFTYMHGWLLMVNVGTWMVYDGMGYSFFFFGWILSLLGTPPVGKCRDTQVTRKKYQTWKTDEWHLKSYMTVIEKEFPFNYCNFWCPCLGFSGLCH